jgi:hypothetical protein
VDGLKALDPNRPIREADIRISVHPLFDHPVRVSPVSALLLKATFRVLSVPTSPDALIHYRNFI